MSTSIEDGRSPDDDREHTSRSTSSADKKKHALGYSSDDDNMHAVQRTSRSKIPSSDVDREFWTSELMNDGHKNQLQDLF
jgi:hypothetical protein